MTQHEKQRTGYAELLSKKLGLRVTYYRHPCTGKWRGSYDVGYLIGEHILYVGNTFGEHGKQTNEIFRHYESVEKKLIEELQRGIEHHARFPQYPDSVATVKAYNGLMKKLGGEEQ